MVDRHKGDLSFISFVFAVILRRVVYLLELKEEPKRKAVKTIFEMRSRFSGGRIGTHEELCFLFSYVFAMMLRCVVYFLEVEKEPKRKAI